VIEQGGKNSEIGRTFERILGRRVEQLGRLGISQRWGRAFIGIGGWPLDTIDRVLYRPTITWKKR
jgi:hypothetical protein